MTDKSRQRYDKMLAMNETIHPNGWVQFMFAFRGDLLPEGVDLDRDILQMPFVTGKGTPAALIS